MIERPRARDRCRVRGHAQRHRWLSAVRANARPGFRDEDLAEVLRSLIAGALDRHDRSRGSLPGSLRCPRTALAPAQESDAGKPRLPERASHEAALDPCILLSAACRRRSRRDEHGYAGERIRAHRVDNRIHCSRQAKLARLAGRIGVQAEIDGACCSERPKRRKNALRRP